jgi:hypothetical protein
VAPPRAVVDLPEEVFSGTPDCLTHVIVIFHGTQMGATVVQLDHYVIADVALAILDPYLRADLAVGKASLDLLKVLFDLCSICITQVSTGGCDLYEHCHLRSRPA